jgi:hypothetical protein
MTRTMTRTMTRQERYRNSDYGEMSRSDSGIMVRSGSLYPVPPKGGKMLRSDSGKMSRSGSLYPVPPKGGKMLRSDSGKMSRSGCLYPTIGSPEGRPILIDSPEGLYHQRAEQ